MKSLSTQIRRSFHSIRTWVEVRWDFAMTVCWLAGELGIASWVIAFGLSSSALMGTPAQSKAQDLSDQAAQNVQIKIDTDAIRDLQRWRDRVTESSNQSILVLTTKIDETNAIAKSASETSDRAEKIQYAILAMIVLDVVRRWTSEKKPYKSKEE